MLTSSEIGVIRNYSKYILKQMLASNARYCVQVKPKKCIDTMKATMHRLRTKM